MLENVKEIHIEATSLCNAECPMCARNVLGKGLNPYITLKSLSTKWFEENLKPNSIKKLEKVFFCGNVGDPASTPELLGIISYLKNSNPDLIVGLNSNGGLKTRDWWSQLGKLLQGPLDYCVFSIDGLEDTNHIYRMNVNWQKVMENAKAFIDTGASAHWDMLVFNHNKHQVNKIKNLADSMGFKWFRTKETDRWDIYQEVDVDPATQFVPKVYSKQVKCEKNRDASVFLDYTGKFWPCCHMAEAYLNKIGYELHQDLRMYDNEQLMTEYQLRLDNGNPFYVCSRACGITTNKRQQWKSETQLR
jgi:MoaA/NifB/PqqE/SkfB family radical SAM enzyme